MKKLVLAYSGGLDTSYCAKYLSKEENYDVHAVSVNTGGFSDQEIETLNTKALAMGVSTYTNINAVPQFYQKVVKYLIFGNVLKNNAYAVNCVSAANYFAEAFIILNKIKSHLTSPPFRVSVFSVQALHA